MVSMGWRVPRALVPLLDAGSGARLPESDLVVWVSGLVHGGLEAQAGHTLEVRKQGLAAYGDEIEGARQSDGDAGEERAADPGRHHLPPGASVSRLSLACHSPHSAGAAASRTTGRSRIGRCTAVAISPTAIDIHHIISYDLVAS
jgi:hypothetical protein